MCNHTFCSLFSLSLSLFFPFVEPLFARFFCISLRLLFPLPLPPSPCFPSYCSASYQIRATSVTCVRGCFCFLFCSFVSFSLFPLSFFFVYSHGCALLYRSQTQLFIAVGVYFFSCFLSSPFFCKYLGTWLHAPFLFRFVAVVYFQWSWGNLNFYGRQENNNIKRNNKQIRNDEKRETERKKKGRSATRGVQTAKRLDVMYMLMPAAPCVK